MTRTCFSPENRATAGPNSLVAGSQAVRDKGSEPAASGASREAAAMVATDLRAAAERNEKRAAQLAADAAASRAFADELDARAEMSRAYAAELRLRTEEAQS